MFMYVGAIISFIIILAIWWVVQAFVFKGQFNAVEVAVQVILVLGAVFIAAIITQKVVHKEGIKVTIPK